MILMLMLGCAQDVWNQVTVNCEAEELSALAYQLESDKVEPDDTPLVIRGTNNGEDYCEATFRGLRDAEIRRAPEMVAGIDAEQLVLSYSNGSFPYFKAGWPSEREVDIKIDDLVGTSVTILANGGSDWVSDESYFSFGSAKSLSPLKLDDPFEDENVVISCGSCESEIDTLDSVSIDWVGESPEIQHTITHDGAEVRLSVEGFVRAVVDWEGGDHSLSLESFASQLDETSVTVTTPENTHWVCHANGTTGALIYGCESLAGDGASWILQTEGIMKVTFETFPQAPE